MFSKCFFRLLCHIAEQVRDCDNGIGSIWVFFIKCFFFISLFYLVVTEFLLSAHSPLHGVEAIEMGQSLPGLGLVCILSGS